MFLIFTSATQAPIYYAFNHIDIGTASLLFFVTQLLTLYMVGFQLLGETRTKTKIFSFLVACVGLYLVFSFSLAHFVLLAVLAAILNGIASGGEVAFTKKLSHKYSPLYLVGLSNVAMVITNLPISLVMREQWLAPELNIAWLTVVGYAVVGMFGFAAVIAGLKYLDASIGGLLGLFEIIFSVTFGILLFQEGLTPHIVIGGILIVLAAALPHITTRRE